MTGEVRMTDLLYIVHGLCRITATETDDAKTQLSELCASTQTKHKEQCDTFTRDQNLDIFYSKIFAVM